MSQNLSKASVQATSQETGVVIVGVSTSTPNTGAGNVEFEAINYYNVGVTNLTGTAKLSGDPNPSITIGAVSFEMTTLPAGGVTVGYVEVTTANTSMGNYVIDITADYKFDGPTSVQGSTTADVDET